MSVVPFGPGRRNCRWLWPKTTVLSRTPFSIRSSSSPGSAGKLSTSDSGRAVDIENAVQLLCGLKGIQPTLVGTEAGVLLLERLPSPPAGRAAAPAASARRCRGSTSCSAVRAGARSSRSATATKRQSRRRGDSRRRRQPPHPSAPLRARPGSRGCRKGRRARLTRLPQMELNLHAWGDVTAPPVVFLHGLNAHGRRFRRLAEERLADRFHVLAPDLRGHAGSGLGATVDDRDECSRRARDARCERRP